MSDDVAAYVVVDTTNLYIEVDEPEININPDVIELDIRVAQMQLPGS